MNKRMKKALVCDALTMALFRRKFPKQVIVHSDRGANTAHSNINNYSRIIGSLAV